MTEEQEHTILVIDDEEIIRRNFKGYLEDEGYRTLITDDGHEALEMLGRERADLMLVDLRMPKMDGLEVLARVKKTSPDTPVIVVSGTGRLEDAIEALRLGAWDYLLKPVEDMSILAHAVEKSLERARLILENRKHQQRLEQLVAERTAELETAFAKLKKSERFLNAIIENIPDMVFVKDAKDLRFVRFNKSGEDLLGYFRDELIGKSDYDLFPKQEAAFFIGKDREVIDKKILLDIPEEHIQTRYKGKRTLHTKKIPLLDEKGQPEYLLGISEDITERKWSEEEREKLQANLRQAQKMEAIGTLAGGIAHDFNNILSAILGFTEISMREVPPGSKLEHNLQRVFNAGIRAGDLVKQILTFSRQTEREIKTVQVKPIIKESLKLIRASLPATIEIHHDIGNESPIMADPTQVHQIIMNLCTNAAHAMQESGGKMVVSLTDVKLGAEVTDLHPDLAPGPFVKLTVTDSGQGMAPEIKDRIFDPFFSTKDLGEGTGLGLSVVHGIVKDSGGMVAVESTPGAGSTFDIFFPVIESEQDAEIVTHTPLSTGTERILFVDDEEHQVEMGKQLLEILGYRVTATTSSREALKVFSAKPHEFDLVITDMTMPKMTGDVLAEEILTIRSDIPIILCTGYSEKLTPAKANVLGIKAVVMKPAVVEEIAGTIRRVLDQNIND